MIVIIIFSRQREIVAVLVNSWRWRVYTILCISSYFTVCVISRLLEVRFCSAAIPCFCMKALPIKLSPLAFEKVGRDLWMTRPPSASWLHLLPSSISNTIWVILPRTPVLSGTVPQRVRQRLKHRGRGEEQGMGRSWKIPVQGMNHLCVFLLGGRSGYHQG